MLSNCIRLHLNTSYRSRQQIYLYIVFIYVIYRFDPERFNKVTMATRPAFAFQPFGFAGDRKCPFDVFTYVETTECLLSVLRQFELQLVPGQDVHRVYGIVTHPSQDIKITIKRR